MSDANKRVVRRIFEDLFNRDRIDLIPEIYAEDVIASDPANQTEVVGREAIGQMVQGYRGLFPDHVYEVQDMVAEGDKVCVQWAVRPNFPTFRTEFAVTGISLCVFRDGKVAKITQHWDNMGLFKEIGAIDHSIDLDHAIGVLMGTVESLDPNAKL